MKPTRSVLIFSAVLACSWAGSGVGQEQQNPLQIFKDALKNAKDALKTALPPKTGAPPASPAPTAAPAQPDAPRAAQTGTAANRAGGAPGEPAAGAYEGLVTSDAPSAPPVRGPGKAPPDIGGVRLGMSPEEVRAALSKRYPGSKIDVQKLTADVRSSSPPPEWVESVSIGLNQLVAPDDQIQVMFTPPPGKQVVWAVQRTLSKQKIYQANVLAGLREKYGRESLTGKQDGTLNAATDDSEVRTMTWIFDRQGHPALPPAGGANTVYGCWRGNTRVSWTDIASRGLAQWEKELSAWPWCSSSGILVEANINGAPIAESLFVKAVDNPTAESAMRAEGEWLSKLAAAAAQREIDASKQSKPNL